MTDFHFKRSAAVKDECVRPDDFEALRADFQSGIAAMTQRRDAMSFTKTFVEGLPGLKSDVMLLPGQLMLIAVDLSLPGWTGARVRPSDVQNMPPKLAKLIEEYFLSSADAATDLRAESDEQSEPARDDVQDFEIVDAVSGADPVPEPGRKIRIEAAKGVATPRSGPWSETEYDTTRRMLDAGENHHGIAAALGRNAAGVSAVVRKLRREMQEEQTSTAVAPAKPGDAGSARVDPLDMEAGVADEAPAEPVSPVPQLDIRAIAKQNGRDLPIMGGAAAIRSDDRRPSAASFWTVHLDELGNDEFWTPKVDLALVTALVTGTKAKAIATAWKVDLSVVRDRWQALYLDGNQPTPDGQKRLIEALKARVAQHP